MCTTHHRQPIKHQPPCHQHRSNVLRYVAYRDEGAFGVEGERVHRIRRYCRAGARPMTFESKRFQGPLLNKILHGCSAFDGADGIARPIGEDRHRTVLVLEAGARGVYEPRLAAALETLSN